MRSRRVVVTRAAHQAAELSTLLEARGAVPVLYPCIAIAPPEDTRELDEGILRASQGGFDAIVVTSANTAFALLSRLLSLGLPPASLGKTRIAAVGPATASAVRSMLGLAAETVPEEYTSESLSLSLSPVRGDRIFLPQSNIAPSSLRESLARAGADVYTAAAYRTVLGSGGADVPRLLEKKEIDAVTFTSSSCAENFSRRITSEGGALRFLDGVCAACLGAKTADTAAAAGIHVTVVARENTLEGLVAALERCL
jgi:uroporphyrinogen-III synthase